jgi:antitoxin component HigA of HigAB toxin-antitoxin module
MRNPARQPMDGLECIPLAPIKSDEQLYAAHRVMDQLLAQGALNAGEEMYLDALGDLVAAYEDEHYPSHRPRTLTCSAI